MGIESHGRCYILVGPEDDKRVRESADGKAPRLDYRVIAELVNGIVVRGSPPPTSFRTTKPLAVLRSIIPNFIMAFKLIRHIEDGSVILSTGETWGLPCGLILGLTGPSNVRHYVYVHRVFSSTWRRFLHLFRPFLGIDGWFCVTSKQQKALREILGEDTEVKVVSQGVDIRFFSPDHESDALQTCSPYVLAVGAEMRDYSLFFEAVGKLDLPVIVRASSRWMASQRERVEQVPPNVKLIGNRLSYRQLRDLYSGAAVVVVPLKGTLQAAGITTILEAMAMQKRVIATRSEGLPDILVHMQTGVIVDATPSDLAAAIVEVVSTDDMYELMAERARSSVEEAATLERFAKGIASVIRAQA